MFENTNDQLGFRVYENQAIDIRYYRLQYYHKLGSNLLSVILSTFMILVLGFLFLRFIWLKLKKYQVNIGPQVN